MTAPATPAHAPLPTTGGSYVRQADGTLRLISATAPAAAPSPPPTPPQEAPQGAPEAATPIDPRPRPKRAR